MRRNIRWLWVFGILGYSAAAIGQTPPASTAGTRFDGKYAFVSSTKVNETYMGGGTRPSLCPDKKARPQLTVVNGRARYSSSRGTRLEGTVGLQGELAMRFVKPRPKVGRPGEITTHGRIDGNGNATARQISDSCSYDFVWQK